MTNRKIVIIGAGSASFTVGLIADLIFEGSPWEVRLVDIAPDSLGVAYHLAARMLRERPAPIVLKKSTERRKMLPIFQIMGKNISLQGGPGSGQHCKLCNQIVIAGAIVGVCEAMAYAKKSGLDPQQVLQSITSGAANSWTLSNLAPKMLSGNFDPGFYVKHFIKDMGIAAESAKQMGLAAPGLDLAKSLYEKLAAQGGENLGTQALFKLYSS